MYLYIIIAFIVSIYRCKPVCCSYHAPQQPGGQPGSLPLHRRGLCLPVRPTHSETDPRSAGKAVITILWFHLFIPYILKRTHLLRCAHYCWVSQWRSTASDHEWTRSDANYTSRDLLLVYLAGFLDCNGCSNM